MASLLLIHATMGPMAVHFLNLGCATMQFFGYTFSFYGLWRMSYLLHLVKILTWLPLFLTWMFLPVDMFYALWNHIYFIYSWDHCIHIYSHHHPVSAITNLAVLAVWSVTKWLEIPDNFWYEVWRSQFINYQEFRVISSNHIWKSDCTIEDKAHPYIICQSDIGAA